MRAEERSGVKSTKLLKQTVPSAIHSQTSLNESIQNLRGTMRPSSSEELGRLVMRLEANLLLESLNVVLIPITRISDNYIIILNSQRYKLIC